MCWIQTLQNFLTHIEQEWECIGHESFTLSIQVHVVRPGSITYDPKMCAGIVQSGHQTYQCTRKKKYDLFCGLHLSKKTCATYTVSQYNRQFTHTTLFLLNICNRNLSSSSNNGGLHHAKKQKTSGTSYNPYQRQQPISPFWSADEYRIVQDGETGTYYKWFLGSGLLYQTDEDDNMDYLVGTHQEIGEQRELLVC